MSIRLEISAFLQEARFRTLIDVRSPSEFAQGHIPGAFNLPLFSDEERAKVGTLYKQIGKEKAFSVGLEIAGGKMNGYLEAVRNISKGKNLAVYCWRGGKRSESLSWLFGMAGYDVVTLIGGYKSFRHYIFDQFDRLEPKLIVLGGRTGSGKTEILHELKKQGEQILDLEALANHKGSAFGKLGELPQPSCEQFENLLYFALTDLDFSKRIWLENESQAIGKVFIPLPVWNKKITAALIHLEMPLSIRAKRLVVDYAQYSREELASCFEKIGKKLGGLRLKQALDFLSQNDFESAAKLSLEYYDKSYDHGVQSAHFSPRLTLEMLENEPQKAALKIIKIADNQIFR